MTRKIFIASCFCFAAILILGVLPGCNNKGIDAAKGKSTTPPPHLDYGPHGGPCAEWGEEDYHAELIVDADKKQVIVYILDGDAKAAPKKIDASKITEVKLTIREAKSITLDLKHDPKLSGDKGIAFTAEHEKFAKPDGMKVNISGRVGNDPPYSGDVEYKAPKKIANLFLIPGGIYTKADIDANGNTTPDEKFKGVRFKHSHDKLKPGDKICAVTRKKANSECAWTVAGQRYEFCCQPCVDDFVEWAYHDTDKIEKASAPTARRTAGVSRLVSVLADMTPAG